jgi:hypothetical protein
MSPSDPELIRLYAQGWTYTAIRDQRILEATGLHPTQAAQRVRALLRDPEAEAAYPVEIHRLRRIVEGRRRGRVSAPVG